MIPWEESSRARIILTKIIGLATLMDDTFDVRASFEECERFNEAIQRWEESAVSILPDYLQPLYIETLSYFKEFTDMMKPHEKQRVSYLIKDYKVQCKLYLQEAKWAHENTMPTFKEQADVSIVSSFVPALCLVALMGVEEGDLATKEAIEWGLGVPEMYIGSGKIGRFLNDIASYKEGKNKKDVASCIECYAKEHRVTLAEAAAAMSAMVEHAWRRMNQEYMEMDRAALPAADIVVGTSRVLEVIYLCGRDAYTFGRQLKHIIVPLLLEPVPPVYNK